MEIFEGKVVEIIYRNEENGYTVGVLETSEQEVLTFVGTFIDINEMDYIRLSGFQKLHPTYGHQLDVKTYEIPQLDTLRSIYDFLASGVIDEVGPKIAQRIIDRFGEDTLEILDNNPTRLLEVDGIGNKKYVKIIESYREKIKLRSIVMQLSAYGINPGVAMKIFKAFGDDTIEVIRHNPYEICSKIKGIGFVKADEIARKIGIPKDSLSRIIQGVKFILEEYCYQGNMFMYFDELKYRSAQLLECSEDLFEKAIYELCISYQAVLENKDDVRRVYIQSFYKAENEVSKKIIDLVCESQDITLESKKAEIMIKETEDRIGKTLAQKQKEAVVSALGNKAMILTGGPGTGKTTIISFIIECFENIGKKVTLCAPTGRAAKRLSEASGKKASTIHRLLEVGYTDENSEESYYNRDESNPLDTDVLIVDEMSMVDIFLMKALLNALKSTTSIVMVGDKDQLPSVGAGRVLWDLIECKLVKTVVLDEIFRQEKESNIIINAHRVNKGENLKLEKGALDFFFMAREN
ncbi:MAG: SF1B family DNA helicase RecD2, partial [Proteocatella sp.]